MQNGARRRAASARAGHLSIAAPPAHWPALRVLRAATGVPVAKPPDRPQATRAEGSRVRTFWRILLAAAALVVVAALGFVSWIVFGPGPTDLPNTTGQDRVALSDYKLGRSDRRPREPQGRDPRRPWALSHPRRRLRSLPYGHRGTIFRRGRSVRPTLFRARSISTNITPDKDTGIGQYTELGIFLAAVHRRHVRRDGARLYPAMPFASYAYLTDADGLAIKAYLFSLKPINAPAIPNTFAFPFDQRWSN